MTLEIFQQLCLEFCQNSSQESKWHTIYFQSKWRLSFDAIFAFYTKNWSFEKHRIGIIALLWQPILQKLNLKCCCHFCFLWLPTIWRDFFAEKNEIKKKIILMHFLQRFVLHFVLFGLFWANNDRVSRSHVVMTYCSNFYICVWIRGIIKIIIWYQLRQKYRQIV